MINMTEQAFELVEDIFQNETDKGGHPYINHLIRVSAKMKNKTDKTIALLHDVIEDTSITADDLIKMGYPSEVVDAVCILSRKKDETYSDFIDRIATSNNVSAIKVKLADLDDNMDLSRISKPQEKDLNRVRNRYKPAYNKLTNVLKDLT